MCQTKEDAKSKIDELTEAMHRLASALERSLDREEVHLDIHSNSGGLRGCSLPVD
ncbi:hypothetical protein LA6_003446 [Marinibacterium anthonyi]|nr:hypothetical protein LA6_003446 [Marinibacterium anthonyi]